MRRWLCQNFQWQQFQQMNFCAHCHGWLWNDPPLPGIKVPRAGTPDNMDWAEPIGNTWTDSKAAWVKIDPELVNFRKARRTGPRCSTPGSGTIRTEENLQTGSSPLKAAPQRRPADSRVPHRA
jgi:hypothetical protein